MPRGAVSEIGATRTSANGYHYTKTENGWVLTHWLTAEKLLGRPVSEDEIVQFKEPKFRRDPYNENGIRVIKKRKTSLRRRAALLESRIQELQAELDLVNQELEDPLK